MAIRLFSKECKDIKLVENMTSNDDVKTLQLVLTKLGLYDGYCRGNFRSKTKASVETFQRKNDCTVDGWVGEQTCKKLAQVVESKGLNFGTKVSDTSTSSSSSSSSSVASVVIEQLDCPNIKLVQNSKDTENVKLMQKMLKELGYYTRQVDGDFGSYTYDAVVEFQSKTGHSTDGEFGPKTCPDLNRLYMQKMQSKIAAEAGAKVEDKKSTVAGYVKPDYLKQLSYKLTVRPDVVVLPTTTLDTTNNTASTTGGTIVAVTDFDCSKINLSVGSTGAEVTALQNFLKAKGYYTRQVDGDYGTYTKKAVILLQDEIKPEGGSDGVFGSKTCQKLQSEGVVKNADRKDYVITDFTSLPNTSDDMDGLAHEVSLQTPYTADVMKHIQKLQKTRFDIFLDGEPFTSHEGYISDIKVSHQSDAMLIDLQLVGYTAFLDKQLELGELTDKRSNLLKKIIEEAGLKADIDVTGLTDDEYTLKVQKVETSTGDTTGSGLTEVSGDDCTATNPISAYSNDIDACHGNTKIGNSSANYATDTANMTAKEAILDLYNRFEYPRNGYPNNRYCPRSVWKKTGTISCNCADIARLVKCVGEVHGLKVGIKHVSNVGGHYFNLIEINGKVYRFDCCFKSSGYVDSYYGGGLCNNLTKNGGPWQ